MQVIGSGFGRTGTRSTKDALETLGFGPCYHMEEVEMRRVLTALEVGSRAVRLGAMAAPVAAAGMALSRRRARR